MAYMPPPDARAPLMWARLGEMVSGLGAERGNALRHRDEVAADHALQAQQIAQTGRFQAGQMKLGQAQLAQSAADAAAGREQNYTLNGFIDAPNAVVGDRPEGLGASPAQIAATVGAGAGGAPAAGPGGGALFRRLGEMLAATPTTTATHKAYYAGADPRAVLQDRQNAFVGSEGASDRALRQSLGDLEANTSRANAQTGASASLAAANISARTARELAKTNNAGETYRAELPYLMPPKVEPAPSPGEYRGGIISRAMQDPILGRRSIRALAERADSAYALSYGRPPQVGGSTPAPPRPSPAAGTRPPPLERVQQLRREGKTADEARRIMQAEGYSLR
jgi:hypothetical protein